MRSKGLRPYHITWLDLLLKALGLVQSAWEAIYEEAAAATLQHGLLQQSNRDLHHDLARHMPQT